MKRAATPTRPRPKAKAKAQTPKAAEPAPGILPPEEEAEVYVGKVKKKITKPEHKTLEARALAKKVGKAEKEARPKPAATARPRKVPSAGSQGGKMPVIRKVRIASAPEAGVLKRGRGRPKGALGKVKRETASSATPL